MARLLLLLLLFQILPYISYAQKIAIEADLVHTMSGSGKISSGVVLIDNGKIVSVNEKRQVKVPEGYRIIRAKVVTPGFIDTRTSAGLSGAHNVLSDQDQDEITDPVTADLRAMDSFNPRDELLSFIRSYGVTTVQVSPGPANPVAGQAGIFKTHGESAERMALKPISGMVFNLGEIPKALYGQKNRQPMTRMAIAGIIRRVFADTQNYQARWDDWQKSEKKELERRPTRDIKLEVILPLLRREIPAIFVAHREDDIATALRLVKEFNLRAILSQATEAYLIKDQIRQSGIPVLVGPVMQRIGSIETMNTTLENAAILQKHGVLIGFSSGFEEYVPKNRILLFESAIAMANGLSYDQTLRSLTIDAANILGVSNRIGSLEPGKDADLVLFDGDPFEYTTHVTAVLIEGKLVFESQNPPQH
jgi:imidazolonepropionase-like amidohydrolase